MHTGVSPLARAHDLNRLNVLAFIVVLFGSFGQQAADATDIGITVGVLAFFATGYAFAFGETGGWFIGTDNFFLQGLDLAAIPEGGLSPATTFFFQAV